MGDMPPGSNSSRGFSLAALFVLVTASAVIIAGIAPLLRDFAGHGFSEMHLVGVMVSGLLGGMALGTIIGLHHYRVGTGVSYGATVGAAIGFISVPITLLRASELVPVALAMFVGSVLIVFVAAITRQRA